MQLIRRWWAAGSGPCTKPAHLRPSKVLRTPPEPPEAFHLCTEPSSQTDLSTQSCRAEQAEALVARNMAQTTFLATWTKPIGGGPGRLGLVYESPAEIYVSFGACESFVFMDFVIIRPFAGVTCHSKSTANYPRQKKTAAAPKSKCHIHYRVMFFGYMLPK